MSVDRNPSQVIVRENDSLSDFALERRRGEDDKKKTHYMFSFSFLPNFPKYRTSSISYNTNYFCSALVARENMAYAHKKMSTSAHVEVSFWQVGGRAWPRQLSEMTQEFKTTSVNAVHVTHTQSTYILYTAQTHSCI